MSEQQNTDAVTDVQLARVLAMDTGDTPVLILPRKDEPFTPEQRLAIREEVEKALYPGTVDPRRFASVIVTLDTGERFRGTVYHLERMEDGE